MRVMLVPIMQIKFYYKMARNDGSLILCANTVQENEKMLHESCRRHRMDGKCKEDLEKLFIKLNSNCQLKISKEEMQATSWSNKHVMNYTYGPIPEFPPGSWWGIRMDCSRDRVHNPFDKNIQIGPFGVTSFCTSSVNSNEDIDLGNFLTLTGQRYFDEKSDTDPLIKNYENQIPVRLIRSYNLLNEFAPKTGYRYDGLYIVANFWIGVNSDGTKHYKFALLRLINQDPPSWSIKQSTPTTVSLQNNCDSSSSGPYEFKKYMHSSEQAQKGKHDKASGSMQSPNFESKKFDEKERGASESAIVTRHVFKKGNADCTFNTAMSVMSEIKSLTHMSMQGSKAHNTNISIRTGLYDSSHSTQHDVKRNALPTFCRTVQPLNLPRANPQAESISLSNKDKNRSLNGKIQTIRASEFHERVDYISPNTVKSDTSKVKLTKDTSTAMCCSPMDVNLNSCYKRESNVDETYEDAANDSKVVQESNSSVAPNDILNLTNSLNGDDNATDIVSLKESQELKSLDSLDTLTPDKILHLINNKCHPLSKLLMGNMIGLTSEQSVALKPHDLSIIQSESKSKIRTQKDVTEETKAKKNSSDDLSAPRYYKFRRHRRLSRKMMNGELQKRSAQSSNILEQSVMGFNGLNTLEVEEEDTMHSNNHSKHVKSKIAKQKKINCLEESSKSTKKNIGTRNEIRTRLRTVKAIKSSMKKHINKKQRREIANLLIDAKIGPKIRGPRNRRLRCISNTYSKHSCERFGGGICALNKCQINPEISGQQASFKTRGRLIKIGSCKRVRDKPAVGIEKSEALKENRIHKNLTVPGKLTKHDVDDKIINNNSINVRGDNKKSKVVKSSETSMMVSRKRKLMQPIPTKLKTAKSEEATNEVSKPCKTDAVTQCSLIKEPLMRNLKLYDFDQKCNRNEQYTFIKIEYGESKDVKSETCEAARSDNEKRRYKCVQPICNTSTGNNILKIREQNKVSMKRVSAFVPVNALDSDLKIARLRSIGFKPIPNEGTKSDTNQSKGGSSGTFISKVLRQNVAEKYNKYTNEENDIVVYMDDELQYQDIEDEDNNLSCAKRKSLKTEGYGSSNDHKERESIDDPRVSLEQDLESPWHGWKKVVTNTNTYWVGW